MAGILPLILLGELANSSSEDEIVEPIPKRRRNLEDPFELYTEQKFKRRFQMSKESVRRLHELVKDSLQRREIRGNQGRPLNYASIAVESSSYGVIVIPKSYW